MDDNQRLLLSMLSLAIRGKMTNIININTKNIDFINVYKEAVAHDVESLVYPIIKPLTLINKIDPEISALWERNTLYLGMLQLLHADRIGHVLNEFFNHQIPVIALKGLVLREFYPEPNLRDMGDADILVKFSDKDKAKQLLLQLGYEDDSSNEKHTSFVSDTYLPIELHWKLTNHDKFKSSANFEDMVWKNTVHSHVCGSNSLILSPEDMIIHLCLHMAQHTIRAGVGLRQICDLVVYTEAMKDKISWNSFIKKTEMLNIKQFVFAVFTVSEKLLDLKLPFFIDNDTKEYILETDQFIEDILTGGVFGRKSSDRMVVSLQLHFSDYNNNSSILAKLYHYKSLIFPSAKKLGNRYSYAKIYHLLLPLAWIHRMIFCILRRDLSLEVKKSYVISTNSLKSTYSKRTTLLRWLNLR